MLAVGFPGTNRVEMERLALYPKLSRIERALVSAVLSPVLSTVPEPAWAPRSICKMREWCAVGIAELGTHVCEAYDACA